MNEKDSVILSGFARGNVEFRGEALAFLDEWIEAVDQELMARGELPVVDTAEYVFTPYILVQDPIHVLATRAETLPDGELLARQVDFTLEDDDWGEYSLVADNEEGVRSYSVNENMVLLESKRPGFLSVLHQNAIRLARLTN